MKIKWQKSSWAAYVEPLFPFPTPTQPLFVLINIKVWRRNVILLLGSRMNDEEGEDFPENFFTQLSTLGESSTKGFVCSTYPTSSRGVILMKLSYSRSDKDSGCCHYTQCQLVAMKEIFVVIFLSFLTSIFLLRCFFFVAVVKVQHPHLARVETW